MIAAMMLIFIWAGVVMSFGFALNDEPERLRSILTIVAFESMVLLSMLVGRWARKEPHRPLTGPDGGVRSRSRTDSTTGAPTDG